MAGEPARRRGGYFETHLQPCLLGKLHYLGVTYIPLLRIFWGVQPNLVNGPGIGIQVWTPPLCRAKDGHWARALVSIFPTEGAFFLSFLIFLDLQQLR